MHKQRAYNIRLLLYKKKEGNDLQNTVIVVAAGKGKRMGTQISKQFLPICEKEILAWTVEVFEKSNLIQNIVMVASADGMEDIQALCKKYQWQKVTHIVLGGKERQDSVANGLAALAEETEMVLIHDGVRPFVTEQMIADSIAAAKTYDGAVIGVPAKDTIKICSAEGVAEQTPDRNFLWQIQTPQTFRKDVIQKAYQYAKEHDFLGTDDASVAEFAGNRVKVMQGDYRNIKITTKEDLLVAEAFLKDAQNKNIELHTEIQHKNVEVQTETKNISKNVEIYTDGACSGNPGAGGYGALLICGNAKKELSEGYRMTTNNRMEMLAVIKALEALKEPCRVVLYSDSKYVIDAITKGWVAKWKQNGWQRNKKEKASNVDLWEAMLIQLERHDVTFQWVKGHADNPGNERCDALARAAILSDNLQEDENYRNS